MSERVTIDFEKRKYTFTVNTVEHYFGTNQTIVGAIRLHNGHHLKDDKLEMLLQVFNIINAHAIPRVGSAFKIPILPK